MSKELATVTKGTLAVVPDHLKKYVGVQDAENEVKQDDLLIPRLAVAQDGMTPQLKKNNELFIPGLEGGQLFNTVTNEIYHDGAEVIPLLFNKIYIEFAGGGVLKVVNMYQTIEDVPQGDMNWGAVDEKTGKKTPPRVTVFKNRLCLVKAKDGSWQPITVSFKKGENFFAEQWNSHIKFAKAFDHLPCFAHTYRVTPKMKTDGSKSWHVKTVTPLGFTPDNIYQGAQTWFEQLSKGGFVVDNAGIEPEDASDTSFDQ